MRTYLKLDVKGLELIDHILWKCFGFIANEMEKAGKDTKITSIAEGIHQNGSLHYIYKAIDFKRSGFTKEWVSSKINLFCKKRGYHRRDFDLINYDNKDIFHLERDVK